MIFSWLVLRVLAYISDENLGCKHAVASGISWFFEHENEGIILEDDVVPDTSFFKFCDDLLKRYRNDDRIMAISGNNFQFNKEANDYSYYYSRNNIDRQFTSLRI